MGQWLPYYQTHAASVVDMDSSQRQQAAVAAIVPTLAVRPVSPTPLPVSVAHDTFNLLQAQTPMDHSGPGAMQGAPQPIPAVPPGLQALEIEPQRVYNQDHVAMLHVYGGRAT